MFWHVVTFGLACLYSSVCQQILDLVQNDKVPDPFDLNSKFKFLIEKPLSILNNMLSKKLLVIVINALDEYGGLRHNSSGRDNYKGLLYILKYWI